MKIDENRSFLISFRSFSSVFKDSSRVSFSSFTLSTFSSKSSMSSHSWFSSSLVLVLTLLRVVFPFLFDAFTSRRRPSNSSFFTSSSFFLLLIFRSKPSEPQSCCSRILCCKLAINSSLASFAEAFASLLQQTPQLSSAATV